MFVLWHVDSEGRTRRFQRCHARRGRAADNGATADPNPGPPGVRRLSVNSRRESSSRFAGVAAAYTAAMRYPLALPGVPAPLELDVNDWTGGINLRQNGMDIPKGHSRRAVRVFAVPVDDVTLPVTVKPGFLGLTQPTVSWESGSVKVGSPLPVWGWPLVILPLVLLVGGAAGGICGAIGAVINSRILRSSLPIPVQILASLGVAMAAGVVYGVIAFVVLGVTRA